MHVGAAKMLPGSLTENVDSHRQWFLSFFLGNVDCAEVALSVNVSMITVLGCRAAPEERAAATAAPNPRISASI